MLKKTLLNGSINVRFFVYSIITLVVMVPQHFSKAIDTYKYNTDRFVFDKKCFDLGKSQDDSYGCIRGRAIEAAVAFDLDPKLLICIFRQETGGTYRLKLDKGNGKGLAQLTKPAIQEAYDQIQDVKYPYSPFIRDSFVYFNKRLNKKVDLKNFHLNPFDRDDAIVGASILIKTLQLRYNFIDDKKIAKSYNGSYLKKEYSEKVTECVKNFALIERYEQGKYFKLASNN